MQISKWVALGVAAFCLVAVGGVVNMPHLYYMAAMLVTLPAVSYMVGWFTLRGLEFTRRPPSPIWEGEETDIVYTVTNRSRFSRFFVSIHDPHSPLIESLEMSPALFTVAANSAMEVRHRVRFLRRGVFHRSSFDVSALDPLGVFTFTCTITCSDELVVYPSPRQLPAIEMHNSDRLGWNGSHAFARHGDGVDASGVREYIHGDPLRRIHWRQTARTGDLKVIEFDVMQSLDLKIILDTATAGVRGAEPNTSLEYAVRIAATVARDAIQNGAAVELVTANDSGPTVSYAWNGLIGERGDSRLYALMDSLARIESQSTVPISSLIAATIETVPRGTTVLVICIDPDPDLVTMVARCISTGVTISLIYVDRKSFTQSSLTSSLYDIDPIITEAAGLCAPVFAVSYNAANALNPVPMD